jgi:hypothetical protein
MHMCHALTNTWTPHRKISKSLLLHGYITTHRALQQSLPFLGCLESPGLIIHFSTHLSSLLTLNFSPLEAHWEPAMQRRHQLDLQGLHAQNYALKVGRPGAMFHLNSSEGKEQWRGKTSKMGVSECDIHKNHGLKESTGTYHWAPGTTRLQLHSRRCEI